MQEPKQLIDYCIDHENGGSKKKRQKHKPKRMTYFDADKVYSIYLKHLPKINSFYCKNLSLETGQQSRKNTDVLSNINTEASNRDISLNGILNQSQNLSLHFLESPKKKLVNQSERASKKTQSLSRLSTKHSTDFHLQSAEQNQQIRKSKFNLHSEQFLPKIETQNGTLNDIPSSFTENQYSKSMNILKYQGNSQLASPTKIDAKQSEKAFKLNQHYSRLSSKHSMDNLEENQQLRMSKYNLPSETFLPKIENSNGTLNNIPSSYAENQQSQQTNGLRLQGNGQLISPQSAQRIIFGENHTYTSNLQSQKENSDTQRQSQNDFANSKWQNSQSQNDSPNTKRQNPQSEKDSLYTNAQNLQSQLKNDSLMTNKQNLQSQQDSLYIQTQTLQSQNDSPNTKRYNLQSQNDSLYIKTQNHQSQNESPNTKRQNLQSQNDSLQLKSQNLQSQNESPNTKRQNLQSQNDSLYLKSQNLQSQNESPNTKRYNLQSQNDSLYIKTQNHQSQNESPNTKRQNLQSQNDSHQLKSQNLQLQNDSHNTQRQNLSLQNDSLLSNKQNLESENGTLYAKSQQNLHTDNDSPNTKRQNFQLQNGSPTTKKQTQSLQRINQSQSQSSLQKGQKNLTYLGDQISLTNRQIALQKQQENQQEVKKVVSFAQDQLISPLVENNNNPTNNKEESQNQSTNQNNQKTNNLSNNTKKYNKYASYLDLPPQNETQSDLLKLIQLKTAPSAQQSKLILNNNLNLMSSNLTPQQAAVVIPQPARSPVKSKVDPIQLSIIKSAKSKFKKVKLRLRILLGFFNKLRKAAAKRREHFLKELQSGVLLKDAIMDIMKISIKVSRESFMMLFQEENTLDFYNYIKDRQNYILRRQRIRQYTYNITSDYIDSSNEILQYNTSFIKFLSLHTKNYSHVVDNFWPQFILDRLEFTNYGQIKNITQEQREMISIYMYFVFGVCNRLVRPWQTLKISENYVKEKNAQLILSLTFYLMLDYLKENNPIVTKNSYSQIPEQYRPKPRDTPLNTYNDTLKKDKMFWIGCQNDSVADYNVSKPDLDKIEQELESQKVINEKIMIGLHPRKDLEDLIKNDNQLKTNVQNCLKKGAVLLLAKIYSFNLNLNENLFNFVE
ncbi:hypothetical protein ABPG74_012761 [Tetrahymena malaccensis]